MRTENRTKQRNRSRPRRTLRGFTLIELLVVIAIIALLVSILLPSLSRAKELARRAICLTRMRGLTSAAHMYAAENDGFWPMSDNDSNTDDYNKGVPNPNHPNNRWTHWHMAWAVALDRYLGLRPKRPSDFEMPLIWQDAVEVAAVKQCPAWEGYPEDIKYNPSIPAAPKTHWSIGMNGFFHRGDEFNHVPNPGYSMGHREPWALKLTRSKELKHAAETVTFADKVAYDWPAMGDYNQRPVVREEHVAPRHIDTANVGFADGHAETARLETKSVTQGMVTWESWYPEVDDWKDYTLQERNEQQPFIWNFNRPENQ
jgi:prepilin-type N-terminal cleavage/methylation domain-containing protein/prepilin-type processing-associated H-X9-DG protein